MSLLSFLHANSMFESKQTFLIVLFIFSFKKHLPDFFARKRTLAPLPCRPPSHLTNTTTDAATLDGGYITTYIAENSFVGYKQRINSVQKILQNFLLVLELNSCILFGRQKF